MYDLKSKAPRLAAFILGGAMLLTAASACDPATGPAPRAIKPTVTDTPPIIADARHQEMVDAAISVGLALEPDSFHAVATGGGSEGSAVSLVSGLGKLDRDTLLSGRQPLALVHLSAIKTAAGSVLPGPYVVVVNEHANTTWLVHHDSWLAFVKNGPPSAETDPQVGMPGVRDDGLIAAEVPTLKKMWDAIQAVFGPDVKPKTADCTVTVTVSGNNNTVIVTNPCGK